MTLTWLFPIVVQFGIVLSFVGPCPCRKFDDHYEDAQGIRRASCSCWKCLNEEHPTSLDHADPYQVEGKLEALSRSIYKATGVTEDKLNFQKSLDGLLVHPNSKESCPSFWGDLGHQFIWSKHSGTFQNVHGGKDPIDWQYGGKDPLLPQMAIQNPYEHNSYQSLTQWAGFHQDPCLKKGEEATRDMSKFAVCTYCFVFRL